MVKTPEVVNQFLEDLRRRLVPRGREEIKTLLEFKKAHLSPEGK
jgi:Zn-dependent oligopeptidase